MPTTTATTGLPPTLADAVRDRIRGLHEQGVRTFAAKDFQSVARQTGRPLAWVTDRLLVLEGVGILRRTNMSGPPSWTVAPGSGFLR